MENTYLTALHGMEAAFDSMKDLLEKFHKKTYKSAFQEYYGKMLQSLQALEDGYNSAIDKEQYISNMANALVHPAVQMMERTEKKKDRSSLNLDLNLMMVVYILPALKQFGGNSAAPLTEEILTVWKEKFPESNISAAGMEEIEAGFHRKWCYITTAVCETFGKSDDCYELNLLRHYRDTYLMEQENGESLIREYYDVAPTIVKRINQKENRNEIYQNLWDTYLQPCIRMIEKEEKEACCQLYTEMVHNLEEEYFYTN